MSAPVLTIGQRLRAARIARGFSLRRLGERIGLSAPFISCVERDLCPLPPSRRVEWSSALAISADSITELDTDTINIVADRLAAYGGCDRAVKRLREMAGGVL